MGTAIGSLIEKKVVDFPDLKNKIIGIDSYNIFYQFLTIIRGPDGTPLMNQSGEVTSHLSGLLYRTSRLLENDIKPFFVFDGKPHKLKSRTIDARNKIRDEAKTTFEKARAEGDFEKAKSFAQRSVRMTDDVLKSGKTLIELMGLPIVQAPCEGEAQMSWMVDENKAFAGLSQDYDCLLFGGKRLLRNLTITGKRKLPGRQAFIEVKPELIELSDALKQLDISREKLIWLGILIGTDFNEKFPKVGPKTALKLVQEFNDFDDIIKKTGFTPKFDYKEIQEIFLKPEHSDEFDLTWKKPDAPKIVEFLVEQHSFSRERIESVVNKWVEREKEKSSQKSLFGSWS